MDSSGSASQPVSEASGSSLGFKQSDFDALLLEAVTKKQYSVVKAAVGYGA